MDNNKESIELKFKIISYYNETIILHGNDQNNEILDNCKEENNELTCIIQKDTLLEIMPNDKSLFSLMYTNFNNYDSYGYLKVGDISINYYGIEKEDIFVGINKLIENKFGFGNLAIYETNVTNISKFHSGLFSMKFKGVEYSYCSFSKYDDTPMLLICEILSLFNNEMYLAEIENETILDNRNIKYNFRIQPVKNNQKFSFKDIEYISPSLNYPKILDFTNQDTLNISFYGLFELKNDFPLRIKLNLHGTNLECEIKTKYFLICILPKSHFEGQKSGYYFPKYVNDLNEEYIFYTVPPFKVILNDESKTPDDKNGGLSTKTILFIVFSVIGGIILIIGIFLLIRCFKKNSTETDIEQGETNMQLLEP